MRVRLDYQVREKHYWVPSNVKIVDLSTSVWRISRALETYFWRNNFSCSFVKTEFPTTQVMLCPCNTLFTPTICATFGTAVICTTGIPIFSILDAIVAPQRVLDPQVEVRMAAPTIPPFFITAPISSPISPHRFETVVQPEVEKKSRCNFPIFPSLASSRMISTGTRRSGLCKT